MTTVSAPGVTLKIHIALHSLKKQQQQNMNRITIYLFFYKAINSVLSLESKKLPDLALLPICPCFQLLFFPFQLVANCCQLFLNLSLVGFTPKMLMSLLCHFYGQTPIQLCSYAPSWLRHETTMTPSPFNFCNFCKEWRGAITEQYSHLEQAVKKVRLSHGVQKSRSTTIQ